MSINLQLPKLSDLKPRVTVIGVGGAGCNAINNMIAAGLSGVDFVVANTDAQALATSSAEHRLQLGVNLTEGLGAGAKPEIGEAAAEEAIEEIRAQVSGSHMVFLAAGMGGGTGTGAACVIARVSKELGILTVAIVTKPFLFEGARRMRIAQAGIVELKKHVDTLIVIPNQNLFRVANEKTTFAEAFVLADQVLFSGVACIIDLIIKDGLINLDFADVRTVMSGMGTAMMGTGEAGGERRAIQAAEEAIANPLLDDVSLKGARGLLLSITGGRDMTLYEVDEAASRVREEVDPEANIIVGATFDDELGERVRVSIVASGMGRAGEPMRPPITPSLYPARAEMRPQGFQEESAASQRIWDQPEVQRRLAEAIHHGSAEAYGGAGHAFPTSPSPNAPPHHGRETWRAPGDVTIEEGMPNLTHAPQAPSELAPGKADEAFTPQPPADIRRTLRRMPDVEDFPDIAQREYRAKAGSGTERGRRNEDGEPVDGRARPRRGLLERMGLSRRSSDSGDSPPRMSTGSVKGESQGMPTPPPLRSRTHSGVPDDRSAHVSSASQEEFEVPLFFNRERG